MLKVMLVDDEPLALEGLRLLIPWQAEGFTVCAECANAMEALDALPSAKPDLIVTDIRMPGMDGLEMMVEAKARGFRGQFAVVSGYGDFEYAQMALRIGVAGYLLKPIEPSEASLVLDHVRQSLVHLEAGAQDSLCKAPCEIAALLADTAETGESTADGDHWRLGTWGAPLPYEVVRQVLAAMPEGQASSHIVGDKEFLALHWPPEAQEPSWGTVRDLLAREQRKLTLSPVATDISQILTLRQKLAEAMDSQFNAMMERVKALSRTVALRQPEEFKARCEELNTFCNACGAGAKAYAKRHFFAECTCQLAGRPDQLAAFLAAQDQKMEALGLLAIQLLAPVQERISDRIVEYATAHFCDRLTLESLADALGYNPTYLGRVFRDEQKRSFREWLSEKRVERAAQLLRDTDEPIYAVTEHIGYANYKQFLEHFKRRFGQTPEQYRRVAKRS